MSLVGTRAGRREWAGLAVIALPCLLYSMDLTVLNLAVPQISADLQPSSIDQLQKLATLIKRNPKATFTVEGYTDSFGSDEYNLDLSRRRAESVKGYLVGVLGIDSAQIETRGYGKANLLTSPDASIEEQEINRRVVVVVH